MDSLQAALLTNTFSFEAAKRRIGLLQRVLETVLYTVADAEDSLESRFATALIAEAGPDDLVAVQAWGTAWLDAFTCETLQSNLATLHAWLATLPRLSVYVPIVLDAAGEKIVGTWCRQELSAQHLIDFEIDGTTLGGCAFVHNGKLYDYSFATRLRKLPEVIHEVLDSYAT